MIFNFTVNMDLNSGGKESAENGSTPPLCLGGAREKKPSSSSKTKVNYSICDKKCRTLQFIGAA